MAEPNIFIYSILGLGFGGFLFFKGFTWMKLKKMMENIPTSKVRSIAMGLVEVFGDVVPSKETLKAPFSGKDCVYYKYEVKEHRQEGKHSRWVTVRKEERGVHFFLKDSTGSVLVDPAGVNADIPKDFEFSSNLGKDPPETVKVFLKKNHLSFEGFLGINKNMRYSECIIQPNDKLYIIGSAGDNPFVDDATSSEGHKDVMISKGRNEKLFYMSDKSEHDILSNLRYKSMGGIFGGAALLVGSLAVILFYLGLL